MYIVEQQVNRSDLEKMSGEAVTLKCMLGCDMNISLKKTKLYTDVELNQASDQTSAPRKSLKDTEQQLKDVNEQIEKVKDL